MARGSQLESAVINEDQAKELLFKAAASHCQQEDEGVEILPEPPMKTAKFSVFQAIQQKPKQPTKFSSVQEELDDYLRQEIIKDTDDPLKYWEMHSERYPRLSTLARIFLIIPATSGSVERVFSVAAAIARDRRARITAENLEKVLCIRQYFLNESTQGITNDEDEELDIEYQDDDDDEEPDRDG